MKVLKDKLLYAIDIIEPCKSYYLLSKEHTRGNTPVFIGNRIQLEFALENITADMVILTTGNKKRCVIVLDYSTEEVFVLANKANRKLLQIKHESN